MARCDESILAVLSQVCIEYLSNFFYTAHNQEFNKENHQNIASLRFKFLQFSFNYQLIVLKQKYL